MSEEKGVLLALSSLMTGFSSTEAVPMIPYPLGPLSEHNIGRQCKFNTKELFFSDFESNQT